MARYTERSDSIALRFSQLLGGINVVEQNGVITITKIPGLHIIQAIDKLWKTTTISKHMFNKAGYYKLEFNSFFAVEVKYVFERLIKEARLSPGTKAMLRKAINMMEEKTWLKDTTVEHPPLLDRKQLKKFKKTPMKSQEEFFNVYDTKKRSYLLNGYLLSAAAGSGKTLTNLYISEMLKTDITIVLCPKVARSEPWVKTLENEFVNGPPTYWVSGDKPLDSLNYRYLIVHYEAINQLLPYIDKLKKMKVQITLDESHHFNDIKSDRTQAFVNLCIATQCTDVLPSSGTPLKAISTEAIPILKAIDPLFTENTEARFKKIFGVSKARANDIMRNRMGIFTFTVASADVFDNSRTEIDYKVTFPDSDKYTLPHLREEMKQFISERLQYYAEHYETYQKQYKDALEVFSKTLKGSSDFSSYAEYLNDIKVIQNTRDYSIISDVIARANRYEKKVIHPTLSGKTLAQFKDAKSVVKYVGLKVRGEALGKILGRKRAECHVEMIKFAQLEKFVEDAEKKTLIFTSYVDVVKELDKYFRSKEMQGRYKPIPVYAETSGQIRSLVSDFEKKPDANPMCATYQTLSTAVPLTMASTAILFNQPFRVHEKVQATARVDRKDQDTPVTIVNVLLDTGDVPNISTRSMDIMQWSKEQVEEITGVKTDVSVGTEDYSEGDPGCRYSLEPYDLGLQAIVVKLLTDTTMGEKNEFAERYYSAIATYLRYTHDIHEIECIGYNEPHNLIHADLYIAHGKGNRLHKDLQQMETEDELAPYRFVGFSTNGGFNHPEVNEWLNSNGELSEVIPPPRGHYVLTHEQKQALDSIIADTKANKFGLEYFEMEQTIHQQYFHISSHIPALEEYDDLVPGLEGLFDGAKRLVRKLFKTDISKGRVDPFVMGAKMRKTIQSVPYNELADVVVMRPEGLKTTYLEYITHIGKQFEDMNAFLDNAMSSARVYLAQMASEPSQIGSISSSDFNVYLAHYKLKDQKKDYAAFFSSDKSVDAPYHEVVHNNNEWSAVEKAVQATQQSYLKISPIAIEEQVDLVYDMLNDIIDNLKQNKDTAKLSKVQVKDISTMAYTLASVIEFYSVLMFGWTVLNQSLKESEAIIIAD